MKDYVNLAMEALKSEVERYEKECLEQKQLLEEAREVLVRERCGSVSLLERIAKALGEK